MKRPPDYKFFSKNSKKTSSYRPHFFSSQDKNKTQSAMHSTQKELNKSKKSNWLIIFIILVSFVFVYAVKKNTLPHTASSTQNTSATVNISKQNCNESSIKLINKGYSNNIKWPKRGSSSIGSLCTGDYWVNASTNKQIPIASLTKVITALVILNKNPDINKQIFITSKFTKLYNTESRKGGSVLKLKKHSYYTVKELLTAALLVSANNASNILAISIFESIGEYKKYATKYLFDHNIKNTSIGNDACGIDNKTLSTPEDLFKLAKLSLENKIISEIVSKRVAKIHYGKKRIERVRSTNNLLKYKGYFGIKTGYTKKAGGCLLFAKKYKKDVIIGVITKQKNDGDRLKAAIKLVDSFQNTYK